MLRERWHEVEALYHSACERKPEERLAFLESATEDEELRREVASLLANEAVAARFLETEAAESGELSQTRLTAGEQIGPYLILEFLGAGGMGEVYKARDMRLDRIVAIKCLPHAFAADLAALERFRREARAASALNHPRICTIHDSGDYQGWPFFVMECLEGQSLRDRMDRKPMLLRELLDFATQIADALEAAHGKGIVHRDIKPANIFVTAGGQIKILDFGLAKLGRESHEAAELSTADGTVTSLKLTRPGGVMGTLAYLSPEQARGEEVDARTDIFSFGVVLYQMATGQTAFRGETSSQLIDAILHQTPARPSALNAGICGDLDRIILRSLEKDRTARYQTARELKSDLDALHTRTLNRPRTRRWILASTGTAAAALVGGAFLPRLPVFNRRRIMLAVLPFQDPAPDPGHGPFANILYVQITHLLTRLYPEGLGVIDTPSMSRYSGTNRNIDQVVADLKVDYVVDGEVRREGNDVHIKASLIRMKDRAPIWKTSFHNDVTHLLALQAEVAQAVAQGIGRSLRPNSSVHLALAHPLDPEAFDAYLRGDYEKSIRLDPYYAPAYLRLANQKYLPALFGFTAPQPAFNIMLDAASKAVDLDPTMADAHTTLAMAKLHTQWKWNEAEAGFRHAVQLEPNNAGVRHGFAHFLLWAGRGRESAEQCNLAQELDPFDADLLGCRAWHDLWAGEYDRAVEYARKSLSLNPKQGFGPLILGWSYELKGMFQEAIASFEQTGPSAARTACIAHALARSGKQLAANDLLAGLMEDSTKKYVSPYYIATVHAGLGNTTAAVEWLRKAFEEHSGMMVYIFLDPRFKSLHRNAQFQSILHGMGFHNS